MAILKQMFMWPTTSPADNIHLGQMGGVPFGIDYPGSASHTYYDPDTLAADLGAAMRAASLDAYATDNSFNVIYDRTLRRFLIQYNEDVDFTWTTDGGFGNELGATADIHGHDLGFDNYIHFPEACTSIWIPHATVINDPGDGYSEPDTGYNLSVSGRAKIWFEARHVVRPLHFDFLYPEEVFMEKETEQASLERLHKNGRARLRYWQNNAGTYTGDYVLHEDIVREFRPTRMDTQKELYGMDLTLRKYV